MSKVKDLSIIIFFLTATVVVGNIGWNARLLSQSAQVTAGNVQDTSKGFKDYWEGQKRWLESDQNQRVLDAGLRAGATFQATGRLVNTQVIPLVMKQLKSSTRSTDEAALFISTFRKAMEEALRQANDDILPNINQGIMNLNNLSTDLGVSEKQISLALNNLVQTHTITIESINRRLSDPKFDELLRGAIELESGANRLVDNGAGVMANLEGATAPLEGMVKVAAKWQKPLNWARLLAILSSVFRP